MIVEAFYNAPYSGLDIKILWIKIRNIYYHKIVEDQNQV